VAPILNGNTDTVLAVNSYVTNGNCAGVAYSQRIDIPRGACLDRVVPRVTEPFKLP
jgi:hypothetical protein